MADEHQFIENGLQRAQIDEFFAKELGRAGYGGMDIAKTPMGTQIVLKAEKPGMVIGKGGKNIRKITRELTDRFGMDDPQIDVQEVDEPDLNARIVADRLANALERGWYFRKAGHTTIDRIMDSGALGAEIVLSGKVTGARSRVEKFNRGYIKHNGEPAQEVVDEGQGVAVMKLGTIGVTVKIIPPGAQLPDDFRINEDVEVEAVEQDLGSDDVDDLIDDDAEIPDVSEEDDVEIPDDDPADIIDEEIVEEVVEETTEAAPVGDELDEEEVIPEDDEIEAELDELDEDVADEAADLVSEMEDADAEDEETEE
ncbi:30S ribosomal protein S3 [Natronocalculus amylovorans]|uniref:Small ribosomal subunit protein uS3 n=1 Tax=Natronocalculus amylovorans TaxID=2917812 RepID=A0AAE3FX80_9EURY|nr:30S ribosomal protein S3 [Natronocalculus amylovorans]MCL9816560.1 30S ribosomal protein S3 [Natronocalculus amylovorans]